MSIELTDAQIVRLLDLTAQIAAIRSTMPVPPSDFGSNADVKLETAKALRGALEQRNDILVELGTLLR